tara:strand:- start:664 stop:816 length:153 start_codon:yes stop_codon:yes gene_type:complete
MIIRQKIIPTNFWKKFGLMNDSLNPYPEKYANKLEAANTNAFIKLLRKEI